MKKFLSVLLTLCVIMGASASVSASTPSNESPKTVEHISQNWIESQLGGVAEVSETVRLYDTKGQFIGHLVSFQRETEPAGYIVLSIKETENPIIEFALDGENVYSYLENEFEKSKVSSNFSAKSNFEGSSLSAFSIAEENVLYTDFINYSLKVESNDKAILFNQKKQVENFESAIQDTAPIVSPTSDTFYDDYVDFPSDSSGIDAVWSAPYPSKGLVMGDMPNASPGEGNCGPTALTNTVKIYAECRANNQDPLSSLKLSGSDDSTYKRLVQLSGYTSSSAASMSKLLDALKSYSKERGFSCSIDNYWLDNWGDFTRDLKANKPVLLYTSSSAGSAHAQVAVGYYLYKSGAKYLKILSGWTSNSTFVKYKPSSLNNFNGYCVKIT